MITFFCLLVAFLFALSFLAPLPPLSRVSDKFHSAVWRELLYAAYRLRSYLLRVWVQRDLRANLRRLDAGIQGPYLKLSLSLSSPAKRGTTSILNDYSSYLLTAIYSVGSEPPLHATLEEEATRVISLFTNAYTNGFSASADLSKFIPYPPAEIISRLEASYNRFKDQSYMTSKRLDSSTMFRGPLSKIFAAAGFLHDNANAVIELRHLLAKPTNWEKLAIRPSIGDYLKGLWDICYDAVVKVPRYEQSYGVSYERDGQIRCFYNVMNLILHHVVLHGSILFDRRCWSLMFAGAALHPTHDDYVDSGRATSDSLVSIRSHLTGQPVVTCDPHVRQILALIDLVYAHLPPAENPLLVTILCSLHDWQLRSMEQDAGTNSLERLLELSFMKGGWAFSLYGYLALNSMTPRQFRHFFMMGALFQLMDDLHDIEDDLATGTETVWVREIRKGHFIDSALSGTLSVQRAFEQGTGLNSEFQFPALVRMVGLFGARFDILRFTCVNRRRFSVEMWDQLQTRFPFPMEAVEEFFAHTRADETLENYHTILLDLLRRR